LWTPRKGPQVGAECRSCPFAGVAMDLALAIPMIIPRPFAHPVGHGGIARMTATIALPFGGIEPCAARGHVVGHEGVADLPVRMVTDPPALLARVARDDADEGGRCRALGAYWRAAGVDRWDRDAACFFPRVLVQLVRLKGCTGHHVGWCRAVQVGLDALPRLFEDCARQQCIVTIARPTSVLPQRRQLTPSACRWRSSQIRQILSARSSPIGKSIIRL
jgi:hypothetical protein